VLTKGQERSIVVWPAAEFARYAEQLREASRNDARVRSYLRVLFSGAFDELPDRQGRVTLPPTLRDYAGLTRDVVVVGAHTTAEIWDRDAWQTYLAAAEPTFSDINEEVVPSRFEVTAFVPRGLPPPSPMLLPRYRRSPGFPSPAPGAWGGGGPGCTKALGNSARIFEGGRLSVSERRSTTRAGVA
jgi:MraZ protein